MREALNPKAARLYSLCVRSFLFVGRTLLKAQYKYGFKLLYEITVVRVPVKVRKTRSLKLGPAAARP